MISDEPDEDADTIDFDDALDIKIGGISTSTNEPVDAAGHMPDWPPLAPRECSLSLDMETYAWFQAHHADCRHEMRRVLRAWVVEQTLRRRTLWDRGAGCAVQRNDRPEDRP